MRRGPRGAVRAPLFALSLALHANLTSSLLHHLLATPVGDAISRNHATATAAAAGTAAGRRRRARPRPVWHFHGRVSPPGRGKSSRSPRCGVRSGPEVAAAAAADGENGGPDAAAAEGRSVGARRAIADPSPLTHDQLPEESIYLLDGTSMLFRAFYGRGAGGYLASNGATEVGAVLAMGIEFAQFINEVKPRYVAMAFDVGRETTFRRKLYPQYKAQRKPVPLDLTLQIPLAKALSEALGCRTFEMEGYEADDVMATLARQDARAGAWLGWWGRSVGLGVVVCSSDKDMCQLVRDRVHVMQPRRDGYTILGSEEVLAKFGVKPSALPDLFGLVGDVADNIPGVKGIGQKGGSRLLEKFETLEGVFAGLDGVGSMGIRGSKGLQALLSQPGIQEEAMLYREIATLDDEVPLDGIDAITSSTFLYRGASREAEGVMSALGFQAPLKMIQEGSKRPSARAPTV
ncbi:unnamed protein product [Ectocarpus sp. 4 AP-2014]